MKNRQQDSVKNRAQQGADTTQSEPYSIGAATPFDFEGKNLTACGGLLPVATMLERVGFQRLIEETLTVKRVTRAMSIYEFVLAMVLAVYVGFSRLHHLRFVEREPMLTGILKVLRLPPQCTFWRFLAWLHLGVAKQLLSVQCQMRERVWQAAHVGLRAVTLDTDTTVHTLFGQQMGGRKGYNPKNKGKKSFPPILTFWRRRANTSAESCTTETAPPDRRSHGTWKACSKHCPRRWRVGSLAKRRATRKLGSCDQVAEKRAIVRYARSVLVCPQSSAK